MHSKSKTMTKKSMSAKRIRTCMLNHGECDGAFCFVVSYLDKKLSSKCSSMVHSEVLTFQPPSLLNRVNVNIVSHNMHSGENAEVLSILRICVLLPSTCAQSEPIAGGRGINPSWQAALKIA